MAPSTSPARDQKGAPRSANTIINIITNIIANIIHPSLSKILDLYSFLAFGEGVCNDIKSESMAQCLEVSNFSWRRELGSGLYGVLVSQWGSCVAIKKLSNWAPKKKVWGGRRDSTCILICWGGSGEWTAHVASSSGDIIGPRRSDQRRNCAKLRMDELSAAVAADLKTFGLNGGSDLLLSPS